MSENVNKLLTIYEMVTLQIVVLYQNKTGNVIEKETEISDAKLREFIIEAVEWYEKTDCFTQEDPREYGYIKQVNRKYLPVIKSESFLGSFSEKFRMCLKECVQ